MCGLQNIKLPRQHQLHLQTVHPLITDWERSHGGILFTPFVEGMLLQKLGYRTA